MSKFLFCRHFEQNEAIQKARFKRKARKGTQSYFVMPRFI